MDGEESSRFFFFFLLVSQRLPVGEFHADFHRSRANTLRLLLDGPF